MKAFDKNLAYDNALLALLAIVGNRLGFPLSIVPSYRKAIQGGNSAEFGGMIAIVESSEDFRSAIVARNDNRASKGGRPKGTTKGYAKSHYVSSSFTAFGTHDDSGNNASAMLPVLALPETICQRTAYNQETGEAYTQACDCADCADRKASLAAKYADCAEHYASGKQSEYCEA